MLQQSKFSSPCSPDSSEELKIDGSTSQRGWGGVSSWELVESGRACLENQGSLLWVVSDPEEDGERARIQPLGTFNDFAKNSSIDLINSCNHSWVWWQRHPVFSRFVQFSLTHCFSAWFTLQVPPAMKAGSFFCEELLSLEIFWSCYKLLSGDSSKSLEPFRLQRVLNILLTPLTIIPSVWVQGCGREMRVMLAAVCPGDYRTSPHGSWQVEEDLEPLTLVTRAEREKNKQNNLVIQSVLFFVLFHGLLWHDGVNPCSGKKLCMWPASPFLNWWIMCHLDCVKTVQSGGGGTGGEFDINCTYSMSIWMGR